MREEGWFVLGFALRSGGRRAVVYALAVCTMPFWFSRTL